jgi:hypothetical protein
MPITSMSTVTRMKAIAGWRFTSGLQAAGAAGWATSVEDAARLAMLTASAFP